MAASLPASASRSSAPRSAPAENHRPWLPIDQPQETARARFAAPPRPPRRRPRRARWPCCGIPAAARRRPGPRGSRPGRRARPARGVALEVVQDDQAVLARLGSRPAGRNVPPSRACAPGRRHGQPAVARRPRPPNSSPSASISRNGPSSQPKPHSSAWSMSCDGVGDDAVFLGGEAQHLVDRAPGELARRVSSASSARVRSAAVAACGSPRVRAGRPRRADVRRIPSWPGRGPGSCEAPSAFLRRW